MTRLTKTISQIAILGSLAIAPAYAQMNSHSGHDMTNMIQMRQSHMVEAVATVTAVMANSGKINLAHGAIPAVSWPAMKMDFTVPSHIDLNAFRAGDKVQFTLHRAPNGSLPLVELCKTSSTAVQPALCAPMKMDHSQMHGGGHQGGQKPQDHSQHEGH